MSQGWAPLPAPPTAPQQPYYGGMPPPVPTKPSSVYKALAIVQMSLGAAGILYALFSVASTGLLTAYGGASMMGTEMLAFSFARAGMSVVSGALLVGTGVGVFRAKRWARPVGVVYAALSLSGTYGGAAITALVLQPRMYARMHVAPGHELQIFSLVSSALGVLVMSVLPVVTLVMLLRKAAREELDL